MTELEIKQIEWDNNKYIRTLREIVMSDITQYMSYKDMVEDIQQKAKESVGHFNVRKYE